jgi:hypothetical protein
MDIEIPEDPSGSHSESADTTLPTPSNTILSLPSTSSPGLPNSESLVVPFMNDLAAFVSAEEWLPMRENFSLLPAITPTVDIFTSMQSSMSFLNDDQFPLDLSWTGHTEPLSALTQPTPVVPHLEHLELFSRLGRENTPGTSAKYKHFQTLQSIWPTRWGPTGGPTESRPSTATGHGPSQFGLAFRGSTVTAAAREGNEALDESMLPKLRETLVTCGIVGDEL